MSERYWKFDNGCYSKLIDGEARASVLLGENCIFRIEYSSETFVLDENAFRRYDTEGNEIEFELEELYNFYRYFENHINNFDEVPARWFEYPLMWVGLGPAKESTRRKEIKKDIGETLLRFYQNVYDDFSEDDGLERVLELII